MKYLMIDSFDGLGKIYEIDLPRHPKPGEMYIKASDGQMYNSGFLFPDEMRAKVQGTLDLRAKQRKEYDDGFKIVMELSNERSRLLDKIQKENK